MGIHRLPEDLSRRIAAGEVIERPLSVVKELIENSLDADAKSISVELVQGGKVLISVKDDGAGIAPDELHLAVEKHATSKISDEEDLEAIATLGYRGEALSSVCAVSSMEIFSRRAGLASGAALKADGNSVDITPMPLQPGTTVVVKDLFYNLPARRKFLKSATAEARRISALIRDYAFAYPKVAFTLVSEGKCAFKSSGSGSVDKLLASAWGEEPRINTSEHEIGSSRARMWWQDTGPQSRLNMTIFVNGRRVGNPVIRSAVQSFHWAARGNWLVMLSLPPSDVDVNVHPAKSEILLRHSGEVYDLVRKTAEKLSRAFSPLSPVSTLGSGKNEYFPESGGGENPFPAASGGLPASLRDFAIKNPHSSDKPSYERERLEEHPFSRVESPFLRASSPAASERLPEKLPFGAPYAESGESADSSDERIYMGALPQGYLVFADADGLLIVDPHAAHERVNYERILKMCADPHGSELLLLPVPLPPTLKDDAAAHKEELTELKFSLDDDGNLTALPLHPKALGLSPIDLLRSALAAIGEKGASDVLLNVFATRACKASVKLTTRLEAEECRRLMSDLERCDEPNACPHGRPTVLRLSGRTLDKHFGRLGL